MPERGARRSGFLLKPFPWVPGVGQDASRVPGSGSGFRVQGSGFRIQGSGFRVQGSGFTIKLRGYCCRKCTLLISRAVLHQRWGSQEYKTEVEVQHQKTKSIRLLQRMQAFTRSRTREGLWPRVLFVRPGFSPVPIPCTSHGGGFFCRGISPCLITGVTP